MYSQIDQNKSNTRILMYLFIFFVAIIGFVFGMAWTGDGESAIGIMGMVGIGAILYAIISYYSAGKITLTISHAKEIKKRDDPRLYRIVENLCIASGLPTPKMYIIDDTAMNAFATGRDPHHASVAITKGLLQKLDKLELEGVMAHELSHVKNYDIRLQSITVALIGLIVLLSDIFLRSMFYGRRGRSRSSSKGGGKLQLIMIVVGIALAILSPIIAKLMHMAISRQREYLADASAAMITRHPKGLVSALQKISNDHEPLEVANKATAHLYIENPLRNERGMKWMNKLFATHPPMKERIARLNEML